MTIDPDRLIHLEAAGPVPAWYLAAALRGVAYLAGQGVGDDRLVRMFVAYLAGRPAVEAGERWNRG